MDLHCIHCSERVADYSSPCRACGGDPRRRGDDDLLDLREADSDRESADLLAGLVAGYREEAPHQRPRWGDNASSALELELAPIRIGKSIAADVLPTPIPKGRRTRRRS